MSIRFTESFDNQGATQLAAFGKWYAINVFGVHSNCALVAGRFGGSALFLECDATFNSTSSASATLDLRAAFSTLFIGFNFQDRGTAGANETRVLMLFDPFIVSIIDFRISPTHFPVITRQGTTLLTGSQVTALNSWYYMEIGIFISATNGWVELRQEDVLVGSYYGTGTDRATANGNTQAAGVAPNARFMLWGNSITAPNTASILTGPNFFMDDLVICDNAGSVNNDFIGISRVVGLLPNAVGTHSGFTRVGGTASGNFTAVNENPIDGDTSYVSSSVPGTLDTYRYPSLPATASNVLAVVAEPAARRDDAQPRTVTSHVRSGGSELDFPGATITLLSQYQTIPQVMETNPLTNAQWLPSDVNAVEVGPIVKT